MTRIRLPARRATVLLAAATLGAATTFVSPRLPGEGRLAWLLDLATHWQWLYLLIGLSSGAWLLAHRRFAAVWPMALICAAWLHQAPHGLSGQAPEWMFGQRPYFIPPALVVVSANLHLDNPDPGPLLRWADEVSADIVVLQEFTPHHADQIKAWPDHPHRVLHPEPGPFGLAILSRHPILTNELVEGGYETPVLRASIDWQGMTILLSAVHPMPPLSPVYHHAREKLLLRELAWARGLDMPHIVAGDLNATPWSATLRRMADVGLAPAYTAAPTWPARLPVLPLDHVLGSRHWEISARRVGPDVGSDHRPVVVHLHQAPPIRVGK